MFDLRLFYLIILSLISVSFAQSYINTSTVNITLSSNYTTTDMTNYFDGFYDDYGQYILAILAFGISYVASPNNLSQTFTLTGAGLLVISYMYASPVFVLMAIFMLIIGAIVKHMVG